MFGNSGNMFPGMMGQQGGGMMGQQMGVGQLATQLGGQMAGQAGQQMGHLSGQYGSQMPQMQSQAGQQQGSLQQSVPGSGILAAMPGIGNMSMANMPGVNSGATAGNAGTTAAGMMVQQGTGMMGQQGAGVLGHQGMLGQQAGGMMGQPGVNSASWQTMTAGNPQAMAAMQAYMQQYAMRMAAYQRMAAAASAGGLTAMGGMAHMGAMGGVGGMGQMSAMGPMAGMAGSMGAMGMMAQMNQAHHHRGAQQQQAGQDGGENLRFWKTRICNKWKEGHCPYGDTCKYAHGDGDLRPPVTDTGKAGNRSAKAEGVADKRTMIELLKKTRICEEFVRTGACRYGDKCTFAHGHNELRHAPSNMTQASQQQSGKDGTVHKTRLCERFMTTGSCPYGDKCTFAHGHHDLRHKQSGASTAGGAASGKNQVQQKPKKQQKGDGASSGAAPPAITGSKRDREEVMATGGNADDTADDIVDRLDVGESFKRLHAAPPGEGGEQQERPEDEETQQRLQEGGGGNNRWGWGSSPSPKRDGGDVGDDADPMGQQGDDQQEEDEGGERTEDAPSGLPGGTDGHGELESPTGASAAAADDTGSDGGGGTAAGGVVPSVTDTTTKAAHGAEQECRLCLAIAKAGRDKMLTAVQQLGNSAGQKLGAMILGYGTPRFDQLWHKLSFSQLQSMLAKSELSVADRIELLKAVSFHTHASDEEREKLESQKYVSQGLPPDVADFVAMVLDGKEGSTQMAEYFAALEVCKSLYGVTEDEYYNVSSTMANLFMNM